MEAQTHDEVLAYLQGLVATFGPALATAVLDSNDREQTRQIAVRLDSAVKLIERYEQEMKQDPAASAPALLHRLEGKLRSEKGQLPGEVKGPSIWELIRAPSL